MSEDIEARLKAVELSVAENNQSMSDFIMTASQNMERQIKQAKEYDDRVKVAGEAFPIGKIFFFQTPYYSYIGSISAVSEEWIRIENSYIVALTRPLFECMDSIEELLKPISSLTIRRSSIINHFLWEKLPKLISVINLASEGEEGKA